MKNNDDNHQICENLVIKNKDSDKPAVILTSDKNGGTIYLCDRDGNVRAHLGFIPHNGMPVISLFDDEEAKRAVSISIMENGGAIQVRGIDGKAKHVLYVDGGRGKILSGNDVFEGEID